MENSQNKITNSSKKNSGYRRNSKIINRKYLQFFFPMFLTAITAVLCNFIDSVIVSNLLGQEALCVVSLGAPMFTIIGVFGVFAGSGGLIKYSNYLGQMNKKEAGKYYFTSVFTGLLLSIAFMIFGEIFTEQIARLLCSEESLIPDLTTYIRIYLLGYPIIMIVESISFFIPAAGRPGLVTWINVAINVTNIIADFILIKYFGMGVFGAACATIIGYILALIVVIITYATKYFKLECSVEFSGMWQRVKTIVAFGFGEGFGQLGQVFRHIFCNNMALFLGGIAGTTVMAIVNQSLYIGSIIILGTLGSIFPVLSCLEGQKDRQGIKYLINFVFKFSLFANLAISLFFLIFPQAILTIFGIADPDVWEIGIVAIRFMSVSFLIRTIYDVLRCSLQCSGKLKYANAISVYDSVLGVVVVGSILSLFFGIYGLFASFSVFPIIGLLITVIVNFIICKRSRGKYTGYFLIEEEKDKDKIFDVSIDGDTKEVTQFVEAIQLFCLRRGVDENLAMRISIACEELCIYTINQKEYKDLGMDIIVRVEKGLITLNLRSAGKPINILEVEDGECSRISVLKNIADKVDYEYVIGLNQSKIVILG